MDYISRSGKSRSMIQYQGISRYTNGLSSSHVKTAQTGSQPPGGNRSNMPAIPVGMFVNTYPARCPNLPATSNSHFLDWYLNQDYIAAVPVPQHVDLAQWSSTKPSEYYGELHSDGGPLTYAPTLGVPLLYTDPRYAHLASSRPPQLEIAYEMPKYQAWSPVKVLYAYDQLSNAPYTAATANVEAELLQVPLPEELLLEHQLRVLTLVRWWEVKNEQRRRQRQRWQ